MSQRMAVDDWRAMIDKTETQSNAEPMICPNCGVSVWQNEATLAQSDAEPVAWRWRYRYSENEEWSEWGLTKLKPATDWKGSPHYQVEPLYTAPPRPDYELSAIAAAIGSSRFMDPPDGGDVSLAEQVCRMREALEKAEARPDASAGLIEAAERCTAEIVRDCIWPADHCTIEDNNITAIIVDAMRARAADRSGK